MATNLHFVSTLIYKVVNLNLEMKKTPTMPYYNIITTIIKTIAALFGKWKIKTMKMETLYGRFHVHTNTLLHHFFFVINSYSMALYQSVATLFYFCLGQICDHQMGSQASVTLQHISSFNVDFLSHWIVCWNGWHSFSLIYLFTELILKSKFYRYVSFESAENII